MKADRIIFSLWIILNMIHYTWMSFTTQEHGGSLQMAVVLIISGTAAWFLSILFQPTKLEKELQKEKAMRKQYQEMTEKLWVILEEKGFHPKQEIIQKHYNDEKRTDSGNSSVAE